MIRQHEAIAAANVPSVFETLPGWDQHQVRTKTAKVDSCKKYQISCHNNFCLQADLNAVLALQGISPGQNAHDAAIARSIQYLEEKMKKANRWPRLSMEPLWWKPNEQKVKQTNLDQFSGFSPTRPSLLVLLLEGGRSSSEWRVDLNSFRNIILFACHGFWLGWSKHSQFRNE